MLLDPPLPNKRILFDTGKLQTEDLKCRNILSDIPTLPGTMQLLLAS